MSISGAHAQAMKVLTPPYTAGMDFSGHVVSAGAGVTGLNEGQPVVGVVSPHRPRGGAQAELICVPAASLAPIRQGTDLIAAASVPMNALTAMLSLELLGLKPGDRLLVTGAAGMLGTLAVQPARLAGPRVLANAAASDGEFLTGLGVEAILPRDEGLEIALCAACLDGVIDGALIGQQISQLVRGGIVSPRSSYRIEDPRLKVSYVQVTSGIEDREKIARIGRLLDEGKLATRVAPNGVFPFTRAVDAYRMAETARLRGRVVMTFGG